MDQFASGTTPLLPTAVALIAVLAIGYGIFRVFRDGPRWARVTTAFVLIALALAAAAGLVYIFALAAAFAGP